MDCFYAVARDLSDAWFQCLYNIFDKGNVYTIDRGSYEGQRRLEFDYVTIKITHPGVRPLLPDVPHHLGIPNPVDEDYLSRYLPYLMTSVKQSGESYTYGERLEYQISRVIEMYKKQGHGTNQACMSVAIPSDIDLDDPPCCRSVDCRVKDDKLHFFLYFRSWELYNGFPANLAAIQLMKEYMSSEIGVGDGEIIAASKGLHLYEYSWELAKIRTGRV